jgi:hypothetical protein
MGTEGMSLWRAWAVHVPAGLLAIPLIQFLVICVQVQPFTRASLLDRCVTDIGENLARISQFPIELVVGFLGTTLSIEIGFLTLAAVVMPWGARVERLRDSYRHALRQTWLHTTHLLAMILLVGMLGVALSRANTAWKAAHPFIGPPPPRLAATTAPATTLPANSVQISQQKWSEQRWAARLAHQRQQPLLIRFCVQICFYAGAGALLWSLAALLRAVGTPRTSPQLTHPPTCEHCGYNLSVTPYDARCPECGQPVSDSLDPQRRPGGPWERRRELGLVRGYLDSAFAPFLRPTQLGREIRLFTPGLAHRTFLTLHLPLIFVFAAAALPLSVAAADHLSVLKEDEFWAFPPTVGGLACIATVLFTTAASGIIGVLIRVLEKQNVLPAVMQAANYLSFYMAIWALCATGLACQLAAHYQLALNWLGTPNSPETLVGVWSLLMLIPLAVYLCLLWKATLSARFANR